MERGWYAVEEREWRMMKGNSTKTVKNEYLGGSSNDCDKEDVGAWRDRMTHTKFVRKEGPTWFVVARVLQEGKHVGPRELGSVLCSTLPSFPHPFIPREFHAYLSPLSNLHWINFFWFLVHPITINDLFAGIDISCVPSLCKRF